MYQRIVEYPNNEKRNAPESGLITYAIEKIESKHYEYDPNLDPQLVWGGKKEHSIVVKLITENS